MDRADPRAGEHRRRGLRDHRHVDHHPVAALDAVLLQQVGEAAGFLVQLAVADLAALARLVGFEDQRGPVAMLGEMPVEAIDRQVELAVGVPADVEIGFVERPVAGLASGTCSRSAAAPGRARSGRGRQWRGRAARRARAGRSARRTRAGTGWISSAISLTPLLPFRERAAPAPGAGGRPFCRRPKALRRRAVPRTRRRSASAWRMSSADGLKAALMTGTWSG